MKKKGAKKASRAKRPLPATGSSRGSLDDLRGRRELRKHALPRLSVRRFGAHKVRARWFQARSAWPWREPPVARLVRERARTRRMAALPGTARWESIGPTNIGGRMTCVVSDPSNPDRILAGAAGCGVWRSNDGGRRWSPLWHRRDLNVGSLAVDPANPSAVYCGTGEANLSADSYAGVGVYRSTNWGASWRLHASTARTVLPLRIGALAVDPFDSKHLCAGGIGYPRETPGGLFTSDDGGKTWTRETFISKQNYWCHAVLFHPAMRGTLFCTITAQGAKNGVWRSSDGGATWSHLKKGLPKPARFGRASMAISPSEPEVLYLQAADNDEGVLGVYRSTDGGDSWRSLGGSHFAKEGQMSYNNTIVVHPEDARHVLCGGVDLHLTRDGGKSWKRVTDWWRDRDHPKYAHSDHHALLMPAATPGRVYSANDGGLDVSEDGGLTWTNRSNGLAVTMYYDVDVAQSDGKNVGGGAQDNGTLVTTNGKRDAYFELLGGDGGWIVYDPGDAGHVFASYQNLHIWRFHGASARDVSPPASEAEQGDIWMAFLCLDPRDARVVYAGSTRIWKTANDGTKWKAVSPDFDGSPVTAIEVAVDSKHVYVGTENGGFFRSLDAGATWCPNLAGPELPGFSITRIDSHPIDAEVLYATVANFGASHVYRSDDGGTTWRDTDGGQLPDVPHHAVLVQTADPTRVYVCNDAGVFASTDEGATWHNLTRNLPYVPVIDLVYHEKDGTLTAATYGRSLWRIQVK